MGAEGTFLGQGNVVMAEASASAAIRNSTQRQSDSSLLTLSSLLQALRGAAVKVELRDDTVISGVLEETDGFMK